MRVRRVVVACGGGSVVGGKKGRKEGRTWSGAVPLPTMGVSGSMAMSMRLRPCPSCPTTPSFWPGIVTAVVRCEASGRG
jgi:hypothetical protein